MAAFFPTRAQHSSVQFFLWVPVGAIFDYFCDQDSHQMIAFKDKASVHKQKVDLKSNNNEDS